MQSKRRHNFEIEVAQVYELTLIIQKTIISIRLVPD